MTAIVFVDTNALNYARMRLTPEDSSRPGLGGWNSGRTVAAGLAFGGQVDTQVVDRFA
jgi:hypothetical protein